MLAKEVLNLCVSALFVQVLFNLFRVIVQFGGVLEVVKEEQFGTSFCLKEFYIAVYALYIVLTLADLPVFMDAAVYICINVLNTNDNSNTLLTNF